LVLKHLGLSWHEEPRVSTDLSKLGVSKTVFDDTIDEAQSYGVILHLGVI
jgi:hypothetical protein